MIQIQNLIFSYRNHRVFDGISLDFRKGRIYGLLGENGVGKTTLLKLVCGLQCPDSGTCNVDGFSSHDRKAEFLRNIFFLPDEFALPAKATPEKYISSMGRFYPNYSHDTFLQIMNDFSLDPLNRFSRMSFGQQKKALLACALSLGTEYVLLDEPTNGLDIPSKADFRKILSRKVNPDTTIIISTHQVKDVENLIDPIMILSQDAVLLNATTDEITDRLYFEYGAAQRPDALYSEPMPGGFLNVVLNNGNGLSQINIEALFNAVLRNPNIIDNVFNHTKGGNHEL